MAAPHPTWALPYKDRASLPSTPPLAAYLLRLIHLKRSNLCLSADVTTTSELLSLAEEVGDSICLLKTHADIINDFSDRTVRELRGIARRKRFLIFEDRKFGDIGSTVQRQYTSGPLSIAKWAEITNAHLFPGPLIVTALKQAAATAIAAYNTSVQTDISVGSPIEPPSYAESSSSHANATNHVPNNTSSPDRDAFAREGCDARKHSVVSITHTISTQTEPMSPQATPSFDDSDPIPNINSPFLRGLLLLAEMSTEGNFLTGSYTSSCVEVARQHKDFVLGFIAQRSLNTQKEDNFITMTPGVSLPPPGQEGKVGGDGLGQQYNSPRSVVLEKGSDVVIVGRGILNADDRSAEAERYRQEAWTAYEARIGRRR
ncbi:Orotidine 5'-phosphate decarboxylase [Rhizodiscina lignyota]|uniref:Orotidine 5'-phosphate decarboxylase n=1 Tax=Rhizodiscina lignyota TaxID=1504668 RepID=A0A9P4I008_9PEZI|nr:Orotidine 5'-phosphate decarboxylase [Rhizodiscina lignyota]